MPNQYVNIVKLGNQTILDISSDTLVSANQLLSGITAHSKTGAPITGSLTPSTIVVNESTDTHGGKIVDITTVNEVYDPAEEMSF